MGIAEASPPTRPCPPVPLLQAGRWWGRPESFSESLSSSPLLSEAGGVGEGEGEGREGGSEAACMVPLFLVRPPAWFLECLPRLPAP